MGNSLTINKDKDTIIWLDKNVFNKENEGTYKEYRNVLENFNFLCFTSVKNVLSFIKKNLNYFEFRLFYVIVSGRKAEKFYNEYVKITEKYNIIAATIVYCFNQKYHETKPYFKDKFLNSGGITFNFDDVINYIIKDECGWGLINKNYKKYIPENQNFGDVFINMNSNKEYELALPILIGKTINSSLIGNGEINKFQNLMLSRYCNSYQKNEISLLKPSRNKNMDIPLHILSKFFIKFYTLESSDNSNFYRDLNRDLSNNKFDDYHPFIFLIYDSLNKGFIKSYRKELYRGTRITKKEFDNINTLKTISKNKDEKLFYFSKNFLSFSKDKNIALDFLKKSDNNCVTVLFVIEECKNKDFFLTNIDIESLSNFKIEKEVLMLPLTCFEVIKIGDEMVYKGIKYRKIYLNYLDKYYDKIISKIDELRIKKEKDNKIIDEFFTKSMNSKFGVSVQKCYDKKNKLSINYCKMLGATPDNNYFLSIIGTNFFSKITELIGKSSNQIGAHIDDEIPNIIDDFKDSNNKKSKITEFFESFNEKFKELKCETLDNSYSIGYCIGSFLTNIDSFIKAPTSSKAFSIASLALGCGLPLIKLIPKIKFIIGVEILNTNINVGMALNGLNILWAIGVESFSIFKFHFEHHKKWNLTAKYLGKHLIKYCICIGFSVIGNLTCKAILLGITIFTGTVLGPFTVIMIGILGGAAFGALGNYVGNCIADKIMGKDQFILSSANLYYKYIPEKYRRRGNNPNLKWNKTYLCSNVKSYIIECIVNDVDTIMRVMNIPNNIFELEECLGYEVSQSHKNDDNISFSDYSTDDEEEKTFIIKKLKQNKKFAGDLVIPYKGINENAYKIDFIIYGIDRENISNDDWIKFRDSKGEDKEKLIQTGFVLSVY